ncbi:jg17001 [Pararge aegeria aegeria]|uniref:Jg17001 protein n=1 Tax=Pararge aegeria aegeria TaxID=348720 RepID=A0A8S4R8J1_9NEOP|nr:jg17001 [Pararge aegeria aegeria]
MLRQPQPCACAANKQTKPKTCPLINYSPSGLRGAEWPVCTARRDKAGCCHAPAAADSATRIPPWYYRSYCICSDYLPYPS